MDVGRWTLALPSSPEKRQVQQSLPPARELAQNIEGSGPGCNMPGIASVRYGICKAAPALCGCWSEKATNLPPPPPQPDGNLGPDAIILRDLDCCLIPYGSGFPRCMVFSREYGAAAPGWVKLLSSKQFASSDNQPHDTNRVGEQDSRLITEETQPHSRQSQEPLLCRCALAGGCLYAASVRSPAFCPCTVLCKAPC